MVGTHYYSAKAPNMLLGVNKNEYTSKHSHPGMTPFNWGSLFINTALASSTMKHAIKTLLFSE